MLGFLQKNRYSEAQLFRNRVLILVPVSVILFVSLVAVSVGRYEITQAFALWALVAFFGGGSWWTMATKSAGPVQIDPKTIAYTKDLTNPWRGSQ